jgi:hypothetical protein
MMQASKSKKIKWSYDDETTMMETTKRQVVKQA